MTQISAKYSLLKFEELYERTINLPTQIITDDDLKKEFSENEGERNEYEQKRLGILYDVQQICLETRSLIKLVFGHQSEYLPWINRIGFTSESEGLIINTYNVSHNNYWQSGKNELISLISNIKFEEMERLNYENSLVDKTIPFKYFVIGVSFIILTLAIWTISPDTLSLIFDNSKLLAVRACLSLVVSAFVGMIIFKEHRKDLLITAGLTIILSLAGLLKSETAPANPVDTKPIQQIKEGHKK